VGGAEVTGKSMKQVWRWAALLAAGVWLLGATAFAATDTSRPKFSDNQARELAKMVTMVTGVAISPLLGVGAVGAYDWFAADTPEQKAKLPWYAHVTFWLPALLLVSAVAVKDSFGTALPPGLKKPLDVAETVENKVSGLVAAGAVVPSIAAIFHSTVASGAHAHLGLASAGLAAVDLTPLLNILTVPFAVAAFVFVWLVGHVINVLILISPFGVVDAALKSARTALLGLLVIVHNINPWVGAGLSLIIIVIAYFVAGWSFRLMIYGSVFTWDFITRKRKRFTPSPNANWMFAARKIEKTPIRTYGKLIRDDKGQLIFEYRPWLFLQKRAQAIPAGKYAIGRGLFYPDFLVVEGEKTKSLLTMPPRYKKHEEEVAQAYGITDVRDTGLLRGIKAIWRWFTRNLFGGESKEAAAAAAVAR
jgi:hypothetical protein